MASEISQAVRDVTYTNDSERRHVLTRMIGDVSLSHVLALIGEVCSTEAESIRQTDGDGYATVAWDDAAECMAAASVNVNV